MLLVYSHCSPFTSAACLGSPSRSHLLLPDRRPCFSAPASPALRFIIALRYDISGREKGIKTPQGVAVAPAGVTPDSPAPVTYLVEWICACLLAFSFSPVSSSCWRRSFVCTSYAGRGLPCCIPRPRHRSSSLLLFRRVNRNGGESSDTRSRYIPSAERPALIQVTVLVAAFLAISFLTPCCCFHPRHMPLNVAGCKVSRLLELPITYMVGPAILKPSSTPLIVS